MLADWVAPATSFTIYLYGSRVRGDHRSDSDVDVVVHFGDSPTNDDVRWWVSVNADSFATINAQLPGRLEILENDDPLAQEVYGARVVHRDRQVICVWRAPKPKLSAGGLSPPGCASSPTG